MAHGLTDLGSLNGLLDTTIRTKTPFVRVAHGNHLTL